MRKKLLDILSQTIQESRFDPAFAGAVDPFDNKPVLTPNNEPLVPIYSQDLSAGSLSKSKINVRRNVVGYTISRAEELVKIAKKYLGTPYVFGGKTPSGFDCSGYVKYVIKEFGYPDIPDGTTNQKSGSEIISESEVREGDLIFFDTARLGSAVDHVGMVISEPGSSKIRMIHASSGSGVTIIEDLKANTFYSGILDSFGRYQIYESGAI